MADLPTLERALRNADAAGDTDAARIFAGEIIKLRNAPAGEAAPQKAESGTLKNVALGALKGASDIGATLLTPVDFLYDKATGNKGTNEWRRQQLSEFYKDNADTDSLAFKGGELSADIAGTAGAGGLIAKGLRAVPAVANAAPRLINAIESGGFKLGAPGAPTLAGRAGDAVTRAAGGAVLGGVSAGMIDPETAGTGAAIGAAIPFAAKAAGMAGRGIANAAGGLSRNALGATTGAGAEAVRTAFNAGKSGNKAFLDNMRGTSNMTDVLDDAKSALSVIRDERSAAYRQGMAGVSADKTVLDFQPIMQALNDASGIGAYKGQAINRNAASTIEQLTDEVGNWAKLNPGEFHTPEGLDALKKSVGDIRASTQPGTAARKAADTVYNSIKKEINAQAPTYAKTMKDYSEASELIGEVERALSLGEKASADTAMRKLQSLMRNNVNTNYGNRLSLAGELEKRGANLLPAVAGQAMNSWTPRGLQGVAATGAGIYGMTNPAALAALPFQSPRLVGEMAYGIGRMAGGASNAATGLLQNQAIRQQLTNNPVNYGLLTVPSVLMASP